MADAAYDYKTGFVVTPEAGPESIDAKAPYIDHGTARLDTTRYFSPEYRDKEWSDLWPNIWVMAGVSSDVREEGDFFRFDLGPESFLIVKGEDGQVRAFYNVCAHRGLQLVQSEHGAVGDGFTCPYHGWAYDMEGQVTKITDEETFRPEVLCPRPKLTEVRCEIFAGLLFITMNESPPSLEEFLGPVGQQLKAYHIEDMIPIRQVRAELSANWKFGMDGFLEGYHFHSIHAQVLPIVDDYHVQQDMYPHGQSRLIVPQVTPSPRLPDREEVTDTLRMVMKDSALDPQNFSGSTLQVRGEAQKAKRERSEKMGVDCSELTDAQLTDSFVYGIFPNVLMGAHLESVTIHRFLPHAEKIGVHYFDTITMYRQIEQPDGTYAIPAWMGFGPETDLSGEVRPEIENFELDQYHGIGQVLEQDAEMIPLAHRGARSRGFKGPRLGEQEVRIRHFHAELDKHIPWVSEGPKI